MLHWYKQLSKVKAVPAEPITGAKKIYSQLSLMLRDAGEWGVEGALSDSLVSHQYVQVVPVIVLLRHPKWQHLLVQKQTAQVLLASLPLLF